MYPKLQDLVDSLAAKLSRPTTLEDRRQRLVAYSRHSELPDAVRHASILQRCVSAEVLAWLRQFELAKARQPVRIPHNASLGMLPRVCIPIRHHDLLLGYLWLIDADESMSSEQIALADTAALDFALALYREVLVGELTSDRETEAIRNLLLCGSDVQAYAARTLIDGGHFDPSLGVVVLVARPVLTPDAEPDDQVRLALEHALANTRHGLPARHAVHLVSSSDGLLLFGTEGEVDELAVNRCVSHLDHALQTALSGLEQVSSSVIGVGQPRSELAQASGSYLEACQAARIAAFMPDVSRIARWSQLGIYRLLAQLFSQDLGEFVLHPGLERLFTNPEALPLLKTLETYLDLSGNALATSERLKLHRTSLYSRIQRFEHLAGANLKDGNERLCLHLGLKLARFTGRYRPVG
ncbi:helix-turn-helix domain-containing protein [Streptomyces sp. NBC_00841]|uniref:PucR family transcriptional regulator n=1 Tax=unclassified Streptomyces TaxID=2593676 RepID=UPI00225BE4B3|nr:MULTISPECIES: helix-turn-helix domain-containing protein [unclassified Streptomyces]MCX4530923.1 helix-turn-helix domain-containing protein [Streptomyces sp. NBC_01669]WSA03332.1 helix-turn-helix domain-containing protein [Streptomyces sp. NBC_00841]